MEPSIVAITKYESSPGSLREAIGLSCGFEELRPDARILVKPNLVMWDTRTSTPPFGMMTTTRIIEDVILLLKERGCNDISIGEGSVPTEEGCGTAQVFEGLGYNALARKYNLRLVDLNEAPVVRIDIPGGPTIGVAREAIEADFFIDVPVLKTHGQTKVSLGMKNLKGCLDTPSKRRFHHPKLGLQHLIQFLPDSIKPALTIIDGIYALEKGPFHLGNAIRKNLLIASRDLLGADLAAAKTMGFSGEEVDHLREYAARSGRSIQLTDYQLVGEPLDGVITPLEWDWLWNEAGSLPMAFDGMGMKGIGLPKYDETLCSGCSTVGGTVSVLVMSAFDGKPFPKVEVLNGKKMQASAGYETTVLLGSCIVAANKKNGNIKTAIRVDACPPRYGDVVNALRQAGLDVKEEAYAGFLKHQCDRYAGKPEFTLDFFWPERA